MGCIQFEWDENKNHINQNKHNISFEEAKTVFYDDEALVIDDPDHSEAEERFIILGLSNKANLLIVCHAIALLTRSSGSSRPGERPKRKVNSIESEVYDYACRI